MNYAVSVSELFVSNENQKDGMTITYAFISDKGNTDFTIWSPKKGSKEWKLLQQSVQLMKYFKSKKAREYLKVYKRML